MMLQCVLQCVAVYRSALQRALQCVLTHERRLLDITCVAVLQCVAVCCSVLQCVAVCCSVLQCVAVCCSVLQCVALNPLRAVSSSNPSQFCLVL